MAFNALKAALSALNPSGERGFEGLVQGALSGLTGLHFRLASSGEQGGIDGQTAHIGFECKLYTTSLSPNDVKAKIATLTQRSDVDLWLLATTAMVKAQLARALEAQGAAFGLEVQIVDWDETAGVPRLAVLLAQLQAETLAAFLINGGSSSADVAQAHAELDAFRTSAGFKYETASLARQLDAPFLAFETARAANARWLRGVLGDPVLARHTLGQPIAPTAMNPTTLRVLRPGLVTALHTHMTAAGTRPVLALLGEEGVGKSWAQLDAWLRLEDPPVLLFVPAGHLASLGPTASALDVLERFLPEQLDSNGLAHDPVRWHRALSRWLEGPRPLPLVLVIDGINQHTDPDWGTLIGRIVHGLKAVQGRVVVSSRTAFFDLRVRNRLAEPVTRIVVPEWKTDERDAILRASGRDPAQLYANVGASLCNPRLLSACLALLDDQTLRELREVSIPHLIFRHLDIIEKDSPTPADIRTVRNRIKHHARRLSEATTNEQKDALRTIDDLDAAKEGRFLRVVEDDTVRFELVNEGLTLAMGLALLDRVQERIRARGNVDEDVARLIEPIAAADLTVDVVLVAALAADGRLTDDGEEAMAALLVAFVGLQNVSSERLAGFMALCRKRPRPFLRATERLWLNHERPFDAAWLESAVMQLRSQTAGWTVAVEELQRWLRYFGREHRPFPRMDADPAWEERNAASRGAIAARIDALTPTEQGIMARLTDSPVNVPALFNLSLKLMAGQPLAAFVPALFDWAVGHEVNPLPYLSVVEVDWLGQYNTADWLATRTAIRSHLDAFPDRLLSTTGLKAKIRLLRFTGDATDDKQALATHRRLAPQRVSATRPVRPDPFDPAAQFARHQTTEQDHAAVDVTRLFTSRHTTSDEFLWRRALPETVRSHPALAVAKGRALISHVTGRTGTALQQGILALDDVALLVTPEMARAIIAFRRQTFPAVSSGIGTSERHLLSWYLLLVAFPHLSGDEQLEAMADPGVDESIAVQLVPAFKAPSTAHAGKIIDRVLGAGARERRLVAGFLSGCDMEFPPNAALLIDALDQPEDAVYRLLLVAAQADPARLAAFVASGWSAVAESNDAAGLFGSLVLIEAMRHGLVTADVVGGRVCVEAWGELARATPDGARVVARYLDHFIGRLADVKLVRPVIDVELETRPHHWPRRLPDVSRARSADETMVDDSGTTDEEYKARSEEDHQELLRVEKTLAHQGATLVLRALFPEDMTAIEEAEPAMLRGWVPHLLRLPSDIAPLACNTALLVASALAKSDAALAGALVRRFATSDPITNVVIGWARYSLSVQAAWSGLDTDVWAPLRRARLLDADSDHALSLEAVAAQQAGNTGALLDLVDELLSSDFPSVQARGLALLGFMDECNATRERLDGWTVHHGLAGAAFVHARKTWAQNTYARHWFRLMVTAPSNEEAWAARVLLLDCVDARIDHWATDFLLNATGAWRYDGTVENAIRNKLRRKKNERSGRLFGSPRPRDEFLYPHRR